MGKYFALLLSVSILMILAAGSGAYRVAAKEIEQSRRDATTATVTGAAARITAHIDMISAVMDNMSRDPRLIRAILAADKAQIDNLMAQFEPLLPGIMKLRLLLPDENAPDQSSMPAMGFADVVMARESFNDNQPPMVQGEDANRHLAVARGIKINQRVAAVLLASLKFDFLRTAILAQEPLPAFIELQQDGVALATAGNSAWKEAARNTKIAVPHTQWLLQYSYSNDKAIDNSGLLWAVVLTPATATALLFVFGYRRFAAILRSDQNNLLRFIKDLLLEKTQGNYPMQLDELRVIISSVMQFKRIKDAENLSTTSTKDSSETLNMDSLFAINHLGADTIFSDEPASRADITNADANTDAVKLIQDKIAAAKLEKAPPIRIPDDKRDNKALSSASDADNSLDNFLMPSISLFENNKLITSETTPSIFRAYDIRGIAGEALNKDIVYDIGRALGSEAKETGCQGFVVGRDGRNSSQGLSEALSKGITSTGLNIVDIGLVPTPILYFVTHHYPGQCGVIVTGSHNPPNYNGLKMVVNGETLAGERIQALKQRIDAQNFATGTPGSIDRNEMYANEYIGIICEDVHLGRPMKVVVDCGNGAAGKTAPLLLKTLGCEVIELFCDIDGNFPNHHPDPTKSENLADLIAAVRHYDAELGLAFDGDGDRLGVVDSGGKIIWPDRLLMLFAKDVLAAKRGTEIIFDVKCSRHLAEQIKQYGGQPLMWKTGHTFMKAKLKETGAKLAGEMSGHLFFNDRWFGFDDALYAAARLIEILSADSRASADVFTDFPDSISTPELNIEMPEGQNFKFIDALTAAAHFDDAEITDIDGLRVDYGDGWGLIRASNTTASLVMRFEADNTRALARIQNHFRDLMLQIKPDLRLPF
ncbi:MAG: phosphomannomutase/phosphoglucomutase [Gammaproteobacteria bacterium]